MRVTQGNLLALRRIRADCLPLLGSVRSALRLALPPPTKDFASTRWEDENQDLRRRGAQWRRRGRRRANMKKVTAVEAADRTEQDRKRVDAKRKTTRGAAGDPRENLVNACTDEVGNGHRETEEDIVGDGCMDGKRKRAGKGKPSAHSALRIWAYLTPTDHYRVDRPIGRFGGRPPICSLAHAFKQRLFLLSSLQPAWSVVVVTPGRRFHRCNFEIGRQSWTKGAFEK